MGNVVRFRDGQSFHIPDDVMQALRLRMYNYDVADLAEYMGVSKSCVYAIRNGKTKWPRGDTLFALLNALDVELRLYAVQEQRYI